MVADWLAKDSLNLSVNFVCFDGLPRSVGSLILIDLLYVSLSRDVKIVSLRRKKK